MILVDTSVWVDHLRGREKGLTPLLLEGLVLTHPLVIEELACGNLHHRGEILELLEALPQAPRAAYRDDRPATMERSDGSKATNEENDRPVYVVRAGIASPQNLQESVRTKLHDSGIPGFSVQSSPGLTVEQLAAAGQFPHSKISVLTVARLRAAGVQLIPTRGTGFHNTAKTSRPLPDADAARISAAFDPPIPNPHPLKRKSASEP